MLMPRLTATRSCDNVLTHDLINGRCGDQGLRLCQHGPPILENAVAPRHRTLYVPSVLCKNNGRNMVGRPTSAEEVWMACGAMLCSMTILSPAANKNSTLR